MVEHKIYVHDGHPRFDKELFNPISCLEHFNKPLGGLWASPLDSSYNWEQWCETNNFNNIIGKDKYCKNNKFYFRLKDNARLLSITSAKQLDDLPQIKDDITSSVFKILDFMTLQEEYDAIEVLISNDYQLYWDLYGWDIDSIIVMNPDVIEVIQM